MNIPTQLMPVNLSSDLNTETEYHNPASEGVEDLHVLLMRLQMTHMNNTLSTQWNTTMREEEVEKFIRQNLYYFFALVAMLLQNQTEETRIQFIDIAYLLNPVYHPRISVEQIVKIFVKWNNLEYKANELRKNSKFEDFVDNLFYYMTYYQKYHQNIFRTIPTYYHFEPMTYSKFPKFEISSPISLKAYIYMPVSSNKSLRIRDTCLELAMTLKDPDKIRVKFLDLAYYFEPIFQKKILKNTVKIL